MATAHTVQGSARAQRSWGSYFGVNPKLLETAHKVKDFCTKWNYGKAGLALIGIANGIHFAYTGVPSPYQIGTLVGMLVGSGIVLHALRRPNVIYRMEASVEIQGKQLNQEFLEAARQGDTAAIGRLLSEERVSSDAIKQGFIQARLNRNEAVMRAILHQPLSDLQTFHISCWFDNAVALKEEETVRVMLQECSSSLRNHLFFTSETPRFCLKVIESKHLPIIQLVCAHIPPERKLTLLQMALEKANFLWGNTQSQEEKAIKAFLVEQLVEMAESGTGAEAASVSGLRQRTFQESGGAEGAGAAAAIRLALT